MSKALYHKKDFCCEPFYRSIRKYEWHRYKDKGLDFCLMPIIPQTSLRVNYCFSCGANVRDIEVHPNVF